MRWAALTLLACATAQQGPPSTFRVTTVTCEKCDLVAIGRKHAPGERFTVCRDGLCVEEARTAGRPFVAELLDQGRYVGTASGEVHPVTAAPAGVCRTQIHVGPAVETLPCAGFDGPKTETTGALPATMLHCKQRRGIQYDDCLVVPKAGFDVQPPERGVELQCQLGDRGRLGCTRAAVHP